MIYLDSAATALHRPPEVTDAVCRAMNTLGNPGRGAHKPSLDAARLVYDTREKVAQFFNADQPSCVAFASNATTALNTAIRGLLRPGDHAVTTVCEHNSVLRPLYLAEEHGVALTIVQADRQGRVCLEDIAASIRPQTKVIIVSHASNVTGNVLDLATISQAAHAKGILLMVDAAQSAGYLPIDMQKMGIDVLCFTGHKGLMGPQGTGGLILRQGFDISPLTVGGSGIHSYDRHHPSSMPEALEAGTLNAHGLAGLNAAVTFLLKEGFGSACSAARIFSDLVQQIPGVTIYGDMDAAVHAPVISLNIEGLSAAETADLLWDEWEICVRAGAHCAPLMHQALGTAPGGTVRFSFSRYSTLAEVEAAANAVARLAEEAQ